MPKMKTHKGMKKRFKVSATGKVSHKRCGSSHLNSHKSGKHIRRLRKSTQLKVTAESAAGSVRVARAAERQSPGSACREGRGDCRGSRGCGMRS